MATGHAGIQRVGRDAANSTDDGIPVVQCKRDSLGHGNPMRNGSSCSHNPAILIRSSRSNGSSGPLGPSVTCAITSGGRQASLQGQWQVRAGWPFHFDAWLLNCGSAVDACSPYASFLLKSVKDLADSPARSSMRAVLGPSRERCGPPYEGDPSSRQPADCYTNHPFLQVNSAIDSTRCSMLSSRGSGTEPAQ